MGSEDVRNSVAVGISILGMYMQKVIEDQGLEKALEYYKKVGHMHGSGLVASFKDMCGQETPSPEALKKILSRSLIKLGIDFDIETKPDGIDISIIKCGVYQGLSMAGLDNYSVAAFCRSAAEGQTAAITDAYPKLEPFVNPRSHKGGVCIEGYKIKKSI